MDDRTLLERAAEVAGVPAEWWSGLGMWIGDPPAGKPWNPLTDDGDALRLAVKMKMEISISDGNPWAMSAHDSHSGAVCAADEDVYAATRRAIVRAAAALAEQRKEQG